MRQREQVASHRKDDRTATDPKRFVGFLSEVGDEYDHDHDAEVVATRYSAAPGTGQIEPPLQCGNDDVDEAVHGGALSESKDAEEEEITSRSIEKLQEKKNK